MTIQPDACFASLRGNRRERRGRVCPSRLRLLVALCGSLAFWVLASSSGAAEPATGSAVEQPAPAPLAEGGPSPEAEQAAPPAPPIATVEATPAARPAKVPKERPLSVKDLMGAIGVGEGSDELIEPAPDDTAPAHERVRTTDPLAGLDSRYELTSEGARRYSEWLSRIEQIELGLATGENDRDDVNALFAKFSHELWPMHDAVHDAIHADAPDLIRQHDDLHALYELRSRLFPQISRPLHWRLTGLNPVGRAEAARELDYFLVNVEYQQQIIRTAFTRLRSSAEEAPLVALGHMLQALLLIFVFRRWRRWAKTGLPDYRKRLLALRPRTRSTLRRTRFVWHLQRIRPPIEWLALAWGLSLVVQPPGFEELSTLIGTLLKWSLVGTFIVRLVDSLAARKSGGRQTERAKLRTATLRLVGLWAVGFWLAAELTERYAGTGVMFVWVVRVGAASALPLLLLFIHWWRSEIFAELEARSATSATARSALGRRGSGRGYVAAALGGALLLQEVLVQAFVRLLSSYEVGRRIVAQMVRREVARDGERAGNPDEVPIADEIILPLIAARQVRLDSIAKDELESVIALVEGEGGATSMIIGERGAGKTIFLERLKEYFKSEMYIVDCPLGGYVELEAAIGATFGVAPGEDFARRLDAAIEAKGARVIAIDDLHRLPRPWLGGQVEMRRFIALTEAIDFDVNWIGAFDKRAWRYTTLAAGEVTLLRATTDLPPWTEEQVADFVDARADAIGLEPDYERLVLPRQFDAGEYDDDEVRNRFGYARILWELADGNPEVSLYLFAESLRRLPDGEVILRLPQLSSPWSLVNAHSDAMLVLRVLLQCDLASADDITKSLQMPPERVGHILRFCMQSGWVTPELGGYRVSWRWYRSVTRALVRQNLMTR